MAKQRHPGMSPVKNRQAVVVKSVPKAQQVEGRIAELEQDFLVLEKKYGILNRQVELNKKELSKVHQLLGEVINPNPGKEEEPDIGRGLKKPNTAFIP
jgi:hypothetical protein